MHKVGRDRGDAFVMLSLRRCSGSESQKQLTSTCVLSAAAFYDQLGKAELRQGFMSGTYSSSTKANFFHENNCMQSRVEKS